MDTRVKTGMNEKRLRSIELAKPPRLRMLELADSAGLAPTHRTGSFPGKQSDTSPSKLTFSKNMCKFLLESRLPKPEAFIFQWHQPIKVAKALEQCKLLILSSFSGRSQPRLGNNSICWPASTEQHALPASTKPLGKEFVLIMTMNSTSNVLFTS